MPDQATPVTKQLASILQDEPQLEFAVLVGSRATGLSPANIDLIDLRRANLAMRDSVAEEGLPLAGEDSSAWARFLQGTWRDLEDFYWDKQHANCRCTVTQP